MNRHSERFSIVWYVCSEYERADEPDRQLLEDMGFKWPTAGLLQTAIWEDMMEHGVDQNTISYNSLLSRSKEPRRNGGTRMRMKSWIRRSLLIIEASLLRMCRSGTPGGAVATSGANSSSPPTWNKATSLCAAASALFALEDVQSGVGSTERAGPRLGITGMH